MLRTSTRSGASAGARIRALRKARGLTQAELAGTDLTKGYVSQVEGGQSRLSLRAAQLFAARLGVGVADVLGETATPRHDELRLLEAEQELAAGSPQVAQRLVKDLRPEGPLRARVLRLRGRASLALDRAREAIKPFTEAIAEFRRNAQHDLAARTQYDLAIAHARLDQTEEAILYALECERAIAAGVLVDRTLELQIRTLLASVYVRRGDFEAADLQAERALELAQDVTSREARAQLYAGLARAEQERGKPEEALALWQRSLAELEALGREHAVAETWNNLALVHLERGAPRRTREALSHATELAERLGHEKLLPWLSLTRARLALLEGRVADATSAASEALKDPRATPRCSAEAQFVLALSLEAAHASPERIRAAFDKALAEAEGQPPGARVRILRHYAHALEATGDLKGSLKRLHEALDLVRPEHG